ncbi:hypothetical protein PMIN03_004104 [Paraphaeosphaeria minitans]
MATQQTSSTGSIRDYQPHHIPLEPNHATTNAHESLLTGSSDGMRTRRRAFLVNLFRPHVRDYESMSLVLEHLGTFCDNALDEIRFNQSQNLGFTALQMFHHARTRTTNLWPLDERINPDMRETMHKFDWPALWNATMEERRHIRHHQREREMYGSCQRSGSQQWIIICAAYADLNEYAFGMDILRYLEPVATMQACRSDFSSAVVQHDVSEGDMDWFSRSFFAHWDQAFQLLKARHPHGYRDKARHILHAFVRQGVNVVDVFLKYWYQGSEDARDEDFGNACEGAGRWAVDRQWKAELDSPFASPGADPLPLSVRTILARADHVRSQETLFKTAAHLAGTVEREHMHREMFRMILGSLEDWATATAQGAVVEDMVEAMHMNEDMILGDTMNTVVDGDDGPYGWPFNHVTLTPLSNRPLHMAPVILHYGLPDELPEPTAEPGQDIAGGQLPTVDQVDEDEYTLQLPRPGLIRRFLHRLGSISAPAHVSPWDIELADVALEACGPRIAPQSVSRTCEPSHDDTCVICLDSYAHEECVSKKATSNKQVKAKDRGLFVQLRHGVVGIRRRRRQKADRKKESRQPMQLNSCSHVFHVACLDELLNQTYPKADVVQCPCCRAVICRARPTRVARSWFLM